MGQKSSKADNALAREGKEGDEIGGRLLNM